MPVMENRYAPYAFPGFSFPQRPPLPSEPSFSSSGLPSSSRYYGQGGWQQGGGFPAPKRRHTKRHSGRGHHAGRHQQQRSDDPQGQPSLQTLQQQNRARTRRHFRGRFHRSGAYAHRNSPPPRKCLRPPSPFAFQGQGGQTPAPWDAPDAPKRSPNVLFPTPTPGKPCFNSFALDCPSLDCDKPESWNGNCNISIADPPCTGSFASSPKLGYHSHTPAADFAAGTGEAGKGYWRNSYGSIDKDAAEIGAAAGA